MPLVPIGRKGSDPRGLHVHGSIRRLLRRDGDHRNLRAMFAAEPPTSVVAIADPGTPLANPEATFDTLDRVRAGFPDMPLRLSANGLDITTEIVNNVARLGIEYVTVAAA